MTSFKSVLSLAGAACLTTAVLTAPALALDKPTGTWADLVTNVFADRPMQDGAGIISLDAPYRAEDAAIVPIAMNFTLPPGDSRSIDKVTLVIDENPAPVAAEFTLGKSAGVSHIETRVRVNAYTNVHVVAETSDGQLYVTERYVKAAGGCSAPAGKDQALALAEMGKMKFREFPQQDGDAPGRRQAQIMIHHPNNSGLQKDQVTLNYIPPRFINELTVNQGKDLILKMEGGISISENPNFRFAYIPNGEEVSVDATDTDGAAFHGAWAQQPRSGS
ncbi:sulfur oxidation protein SoxY [Hartmannibacter diazotrophicus]|uniref:Sulfur oxidation protein SoxY n=1 Tax=Hartmannibacter diazotrophicus TaxID=1482074 RepID=A0A2C9D751_9HYPH|nr:quinoprotein dehydrogenase-associated SoxYZ-like carrier [Hartmannibacter diazotrophicus]SON55581.1 sulfur oxidation protein SoxY [Hartmannibacter diazotrophicus]